MKLLPALPIIFFSTILLPSCRPPKEADYDKLGYSSGVLIDPDTKGGFTGIARQKYPSGKLRAEYPCKDGRFHGTLKEWYENGKPLSETEFKNGERSGKNTEWTEAGLLYRERVYDRDKIVSDKEYGAGK